MFSSKNVTSCAKLSFGIIIATSALTRRPKADCQAAVSKIPFSCPPQPNKIQYSFEQRFVLSSELLPGHERMRACDNALVVPVHEPIRFVFGSRDVIHSWYLPAAEIKFDCVPGREQVQDLFFDRAGIYYGMCAELCGALHARMPICVRALHEPDMI